MRKNTLIVLVGISGSGKSSYAEKKFPRTIKYNADTYRFHMYGSESCQQDNTEVFRRLNNDMIRHLDLGYDAVSDNTNLDISYLNKMLKQVDRKNTNVIGFVFDCDVTTALRNQEKRERKVPQEVIERQYEKYVKNIEHIKTLFDKVYTINAKR